MVRYMKGAPSYPVVLWVMETRVESISLGFDDHEEVGKENGIENESCQSEVEREEGFDIGNDIPWGENVNESDGGDHTDYLLNDGCNVNE